MIIQYGKRAGGEIWSTTAARKASERIIRKSKAAARVTGPGAGDVVLDHRSQDLLDLPIPRSP